MTELKTCEKGLYRMSINWERRDLLSVEWGGVCLGLLKPEDSKMELISEAISEGKSFDEVWKILEMEVDPLEVTLPLKPYSVFASIGDSTIQLFSCRTLAEAQDFTVKYLQFTDQDATAYICFLTGKYYRDGTIGCIENIMNNGKPRSSTPFKKVLGMNLDCFLSLYSKQKDKHKSVQIIDMP